MDAVAGEVEPNPDGADGVVGAGLDDEFLSNTFALRGAGEDGWVEGVVRLVNADFDAELAAGALVHTTCDADGTMKEETMVGTEYAERAFGQSDLNVGGWLTDAEGRDVGDLDCVADGKGAPIGFRVEAGESVGIALSLLGNHFEQRVVAHLIEFAPCTPAVWFGADVRKILWFELPLGEHRVFDCELLGAGFVKGASEW